MILLITFLISFCLAADFPIRLLSQGAPLREVERSLDNLSDFEVRSVATEAICEGRVDVLRVLLQQYGLSGDYCETRFSLISLTAWAVANSQRPCLRLLLEAGASTETGDGCSFPLFLAVDRGSIRTMKLLYEFGVNLRPPRHDLIHIFKNRACAQFYIDHASCFAHEFFTIFKRNPGVKVPVAADLIDEALVRCDYLVILNILKQWRQRGVLDLKVLLNDNILRNTIIIYLYLRSFTT